MPSKTFWSKMLLMGSTALLVLALIALMHAHSHHHHHHPHDHEHEGTMRDFNIMPPPRRGAMCPRQEDAFAPQPQSVPEAAPDFGIEKRVADPPACSADEKPHKKHHHSGSHSNSNSNSMSLSHGHKGHHHSHENEVRNPMEAHHHHPHHHGKHMMSHVAMVALLVSCLGIYVGFTESRRGGKIFLCVVILVLAIALCHIAHMGYRHIQRCHEMSTKASVTTVGRVFIAPGIVLVASHTTLNGFFEDPEELARCQCHTRIAVALAAFTVTIICVSLFVCARRMIRASKTAGDLPMYVFVGSTSNEADGIPCVAETDDEKAYLVTRV